MDGKAKQLRLAGRGKRPKKARQVNFFHVIILFKGIKSYDFSRSIWNLLSLDRLFYSLENKLVRINSKLNLKSCDYLYKMLIQIKKKN